MDWGIFKTVAEWIVSYVSKSKQKKESELTVDLDPSIAQLGKTGISRHPDVSGDIYGLTLNLGLIFNNPDIHQIPVTDIQVVIIRKRSVHELSKKVIALEQTGKPWVLLKGEVDEIPFPNLVIPARTVSGCYMFKIFFDLPVGLEKELNSVLPFASDYFLRVTVKAMKQAEQIMDLVVEDWSRAIDGQLVSVAKK